MLKSKRQVWRQGAPFRFHDPLSYCCPARIFRDILAALFGRLRAVKGQSPHPVVTMHKPGRCSSGRLVLSLWIAQVQVASGPDGRPGIAKPAAGGLFAEYEN